MKKALPIFILLVTILVSLTSCHNHKFGEWSVTKKPTCTDDGSRIRYCDCGETQTDVVLASGHKYENNICIYCYDTNVSQDNTSNDFEEDNSNNSTNNEHNNGTEGLAYYPLSDGSYGVKAGNTSYLSEIVIPETYNGKKVTTILEAAFLENTNLVSIHIPNSITTIEYAAFFKCSSLTSINIPKSVKIIGDSAFEYCSSLKSVVFMDGSQCTTIGGTIFHGCTSLTSVVLPEKTTSIGYRAFEGCKSLSEITIPNTVETIGQNAFQSCSSLTSIVIPKSVNKIIAHAFSLCNISSITFTGTMEQWNLIDIGYRCFYGNIATNVQCVNGTVVLEQ